MSEISGLSSLGGQGQVSKLTSKTQVTLEKKESVTPSSQTKEKPHVEFKMEDAKHAFALMTEVSTQIEDAYNKVVSSQEK